MLAKWYDVAHVDDNLRLLNEFLDAPRASYEISLPAISLFSGAGISDIGYEQAGFRFVIQVEIDENRANLCERNFPHSLVLKNDITKCHQEIIQCYQERSNERLHLLSVTPPCQGMSSSNPGRGKITKIEDRDERNQLVLAAIPIICGLLPRIVVVENVSQILKESVTTDRGKSKPIIDIFREELQAEYQIFTGVVQIADYGIPQTRKRAIIVAIHKDEACLRGLKRNSALPWPKAKHSETLTKGLLDWITISQWLEFQEYPQLDAASINTAVSLDDPLHRVPCYEDHPDRYLWVSDIPSRSGKNAYQNLNCRACGFTPVPEKLTRCPQCNEPMRNRPYVIEKDGSFRLIKGFHSSYRRMSPNKPAPTVMTNSSHLGSDYKIHPWENRVMSIRECADIQTIPHFYDWNWAFETGHVYTTRQVIGEALPTWFTYLHGSALRQLLFNRIEKGVLEKRVPKQKKLTN